MSLSFSSSETMTQLLDQRLQVLVFHDEGNDVGHDALEVFLTHATVLVRQPTEILDRSIEQMAQDGTRRIQQ